MVATAILLWLPDLLTCRQQSIIVTGQASIISNVPQGIVLDPVLLHAPKCH